MESESLHHHLKVGTRDLHEYIEKNTFFRKILSDDFSTEDYRYLLKKLYQIFYHWEQELQKSSELINWIPDLDQRWKTPSLQKDLQSSEPPKTISLPMQDLNLSQALGIFYVLEGSSLGGHVIQKKLSSRPGWSAETFYFYNHYGNQLGIFWKSFLAKLNEPDLIKSVKVAEAVQASRAVFQMMIDTFSDTKPD